MLVTMFMAKPRPSMGIRDELEPHEARLTAQGGDARAPTFGRRRRPWSRSTRILLSVAAFALVLYVIIVESGLLRGK